MPVKQRSPNGADVPTRILVPSTIQNGVHSLGGNSYWSLPADGGGLRQKRKSRVEGLLRKAGTLNLRERANVVQYDYYLWHRL